MLSADTCNKCQFSATLTIYITRRWQNRSVTPVTTDCDQRHRDRYTCRKGPKTVLFQRRSIGDGEGGFLKQTIYSVLGRRSDFPGSVHVCILAAASSLSMQLSCTSELQNTCMVQPLARGIEPQWSITHWDRGIWPLSKENIRPENKFSNNHSDLCLSGITLVSHLVRASINLSFATTITCVRHCHLTLHHKTR